jgi:hypothetical protein
VAVATAPKFVPAPDAPGPVGTVTKFDATSTGAGGPRTLRVTQNAPAATTNPTTQSTH